MANRTEGAPASRVAAALRLQSVPAPSRPAGGRVMAAECPPHRPLRRSPRARAALLRAPAKCRPPRLCGPPCAHRAAAARAAVRAFARAAPPLPARPVPSASGLHDLRPSVCSRRLSACPGRFHRLALPGSGPCNHADRARLSCARLLAVVLRPFYRLAVELRSPWRGAQLRHRAHWPGVVSLELFCLLRWLLDGGDHGIGSVLAVVLTGG